MNWFFDGGDRVYTEHEVFYLFDNIKEMPDEYIEYLITNSNIDVSYIPFHLLSDGLNNKFNPDVIKQNNRIIESVL